MTMDLITTPTVVPFGTPGSDIETLPPPPPLQPPPNRVHHCNHFHAPSGEAVVVTYKECLKNHAASSGGHALDGCCEFMPAGPTSLTCAACGCHRNFHRRDPDDPTPLRQSSSGPSNEMIYNPTAGTGDGGMAVVVGYYYSNNSYNGQNGNSKKRSRTKFSQDQKEKMLEFSEKIGWKLRKGEEKLIEEFCKQVGVGRGVFKVWMHNNKHSSSTLRREKEHSNGGSNNNGNCAGVLHGFFANGVREQETR